MCKIKWLKLDRLNVLNSPKYKIRELFWRGNITWFPQQLLFPLIEVLAIKQELTKLAHLIQPVPIGKTDLLFYPPFLDFLFTNKLSWHPYLLPSDVYHVGWYYIIQLSSNVWPKLFSPFPFFIYTIWAVPSLLSSISF